MIQTLAAIDPRLLRRCPRVERRLATVIALVALINGILVGFAALFGLRAVGEPTLALPIGLAGGFWYLVLQRLLLLLHGEQRSESSKVFSRMVCVAFLGFFAFVTAVSFEHSFRSAPIAVYVSLAAATFLFPLYMRRFLVHGSMYERRRDHEALELLKSWEATFVARYEAIGRDLLGADYSMPRGMLGSEHRPQ